MTCHVFLGGRASDLLCFSTANVLRSSGTKLSFGGSEDCHLGTLDPLNSGSLELELLKFRTLKPWQSARPCSPLTRKHGSTQLADPVELSKPCNLKYSPPRPIALKLSTTQNHLLSIQIKWSDQHSDHLVCLTCSCFTLIKVCEAARAKFLLAALLQVAEYHTCRQHAGFFDGGPRLTWNPNLFPKIAFTNTHQSQLRNRSCRQPCKGKIYGYSPVQLNRFLLIFQMLGPPPEPSHLYAMLQRYTFRPGRHEGEALGALPIGSWIRLSRNKCGPRYNIQNCATTATPKRWQEYQLRCLQNIQLSNPLAHCFAEHPQHFG